MSDRHAIALEFYHDMMALHAQNATVRAVGEIDLRRGQLEDANHNRFLTRGVTKAFLNNFNGVFAERCELSGKHSLDEYAAALFCMMEPSAILITTHPLPLGPTREDANEHRRRHGLKQSPFASYYELEQKTLGKQCDAMNFSGSQHDLSLFIYKRVKESDEEGDAVFVCSNPACENAKEGLVQPVVVPDKDGLYILGSCECGYSVPRHRILK